MEQNNTERRDIRVLDHSALRGKEKADDRAGTVTTRRMD